MLDIFRYICNGSAQDSSKVFKAFGATFFNPEKMANIMESTRQKTFTQLRTFLSVVAVLDFILLIFPALTAARQYKVFRVTDGDTIKVLNNRSAATIRLVGIDASKTSNKINEPGQGQLYSQKSTKHHASQVLNKSVEIKNYGDDRYGQIFGVVYLNGTN